MDSDQQDKFKKVIEDFVEKNFSGMSNEPKMFYGSLTGFKSLFPYKDWEWTRKEENGHYYFEVKSREIESVIFYVTKQPVFGENKT